MSAEAFDNVTPFLGRKLREPPMNLEAEQECLGALLLENRLADDYADILKPEDFADPRHARIYDATMKLIAKLGKGVTAIALKPYFEGDGSLEEVGGSAYLARLAAAATTTINAADYARVVADLARRRDLIGLAEQITAKAHDAEIDVPAAQLIEEAEKSLFEMAERGVTKAAEKSLRTAANAAFDAAKNARESPGGLVGVTSGLRDLDAELGGFRPGEMTVIAARTGMGKTGLSGGIALAAARAGQPVHFFSLEMPADQIAGRLVASEASIDADRVRKGRVSDAEIDALAMAATRLGELPINFDDRPARRISSILASARRACRRHGARLIIVDYLQLIHADQRRDNRVQEVTEVSQGLKAIAKECGVPVLALAQLSREVEKRPDKRPQLADLRESGAIEQDADQIIFIYRPAYYARQQNDHTVDAKLAELIIAKNRHGPPKTVEVDFDGRFMRFQDRQQQDNLDWNDR